MTGCLHSLSQHIRCLSWVPTAIEVRDPFQHQAVGCGRRIPERDQQFMGFAGCGNRLAYPASVALVLGGPAQRECIAVVIIELLEEAQRTVAIELGRREAAARVVLLSKHHGHHSLAVPVACCFCGSQSLVVCVVPVVEMGAHLKHQPSSHAQLPAVVVPA